MPYGTDKAKEKFHKVMSEHAAGKLKSSSGDKVTDQAQAVAIAFSEARKVDPNCRLKKSAMHGDK